MRLLRKHPLTVGCRLAVLPGKGETRPSPRPAGRGVLTADLRDRRSPHEIFQPEWIATMPPESGRWLTRAKPAASIMPAKRPGVGNLRIDSTR